MENLFTTTWSTKLDVCKWIEIFPEIMDKMCKELIAVIVENIEIFTWNNTFHFNICHHSYFIGHLVRYSVFVAFQLHGPT